MNPDIEKLDSFLTHTNNNNSRNDKSFAENSSKDLDGLNNAKNWQCYICGKGFSKLSLFNIHIRVHTGERPFACKICNYKANQKGNMKRHMMNVHNVIE